MMRGTAIVAVILAFLATFNQTAAAQGRRGGAPDRFGPQTARGTASIVGRVLTPDSNTPVRAADVVATNDSGGRVATATDDNGTYQIDRLAEGDWQLTASKGGYITWQFGQRRPFQLPPPISLTPGQRFTADIPLSRGGAISGRIYDASGESVSGLHVRVYRARMERGVRRLKSVGAADLTDDTGAFRVYGLPPGDYYVAASRRVAPIDSIVETTYAPTYFPGTGDFAEAQRIKLGLGAEATATFQLLPIRPTRISGVVMNGAGAPADAFLNLVSEGSELGVPTGAGGVTRSDGTFTLADVAPGRYVLKASLRGDGADESAAMPLTVDGSELTGITLLTGRPATLRGTIVADAGVTRRLPQDILNVVAFSSRETGTVLDSGQGLTFEMGSLSEPFHLAVDGLPDEWVVKQITVNDTDALDGVVELSPGQQAVARLVLTDRVTEVAGVVPTIDQTSPAVIIVFPENSSKWGHRSRYVRRAEADARGNFRIVGLPPGERYLAFATDYLEEGEHRAPEFLTGIWNLAMPFSLAEAERRMLDLKVVER
jgi:Carboxypeptidase regulatory-like domain